MVKKKRTLRAIDLNGSPLDQFGGNEFEIWEDENGKVHITLDKEKDISGDTIDNWNAGGGGGTDVEANPTFDGTEEDLKGLQIGDTKYRIPIQKYIVSDIYDLEEEILDAVKVGDIVIDSDGTYYSKWVVEFVETTSINDTLKNTSVKLTSFEGIIGNVLTYVYGSQEEGAEEAWYIDEDVSMTYQQKCIAAKNVSASHWVSDNTYADYAYKCVLNTFVDVTSDDFVQVQFSKTDAESGNYAPFCETGSGTVTIYSKVNTSITIELMYCLPLDTGGIL